MSDSYENQTRLESYTEGAVEDRKKNNDRRVNNVKSYMYQLNFTDRRSGIDRRRSNLPTL